MSKEIVLSSSTVDDISQGISSVDISNNNNGGTCGMSTGEEDTTSEKKFTSYDQKLDNVKTNDNKVDASGTDVELSLCANCGKEGASNICNKCQMAKYCNAACKKRHRHKHKKDCEEHLKHLAELHEEENKRAEELHDIELFKQTPTIDNDCPICFLRMPILTSGRRYKSCCGKVICNGCIHAPVYDDQGKAMKKSCPFCRAPRPETDEKYMEQLMKRVDAGDAINQLGCYYSQGMYGLPQDHTKALELWKQAAELGCFTAYASIGAAYHGRGVEMDKKKYDRGVEIDKKKAKYYWELGAMRGCTGSRLALGFIEKNSGNMGRAMKHFLIAAESGHYGSLKEIKQLYSNGHTTKDIYSTALRSYQKYLSEVKSIQRDEDAAAKEDYKYIE